MSYPSPDSFTIISSELSVNRSTLFDNLHHLFHGSLSFSGFQQTVIQHRLVFLFLQILLKLKVWQRLHDQFFHSFIDVKHLMYCEFPIIPRIAADVTSFTTDYCNFSANMCGYISSEISISNLT